MDDGESCAKKEEKQIPLQSSERNDKQLHKSEIEMEN